MTMVAGGLAGATPHMISASITAISRLVFEFKGSISAGALTPVADFLFQLLQMSSLKKCIQRF
jgi:ribosomal RNA-processing protein 12